MLITEYRLLITMVQISDLYIYPIKGCAGSRVNSAELTATGFANDRLLMFTTPSGQFVTQRKYPKMALIRPKIEGHTLTLDAPDMPTITLPIQRHGDPKRVVVWRDAVDAIDQGDGVAEWAKQFLGADLRLVAMMDGAKRHINPDFAFSPEDVNSFSDGYATLILSQASLDLLNSKLDAAVGMDRFRPNIVVTGCDPHAEDFWKQLRIAGVSFSNVKPCARCSVPTVNQQTGVMGKEPNRTLARYRKFPNGVMFGANLVHHDFGRLAIGDAIEIDAMHPTDWVGREDHRRSPFE